MFEIEGALGPTAPEYKFRFRLFDTSIVDERGAEDELVLSGVQLVDPAVVVVVLEAEAFEARRLLLQGQLGENQRGLKVYIQPSIAAILRKFQRWRL